MHNGRGNGREFRSNTIRRSPAIAPQMAVDAPAMMLGTIGARRADDAFMAAPMAPS
jgi:hypothetical protein